MSALRHLPALLLFALANAALWHYFRFSITSYDLRPWLLGFLALSWAAAWIGSWRAVRKMRVPLVVRGCLTAISTAVMGTLLFSSVGWPLAETLTAMLREARGVASELGPWYFYHDFSGSGSGHGFRWYSQTLSGALLLTALAGLASIVVAPLASLPEWLRLRAPRA